MISRRGLLGTGTVALGALMTGCAQARPPEKFPINLSEAEWRKRVTPAQFATLRKDATDPPSNSPFVNEHRAGLFSCAGCNLPNYSSKTKFDSGTGWPSFWQPLPNAVATREDGSLGFTRTEVHCRRCGGHLGHVFDDGPKPTGLRYCMNGTALKFAPGRA